MSEATYTPGRFVWHELFTGDLEASKRFYGELFGWTAEVADMGELGTYTMFLSNGQQIGVGMIKMPEEAAAPRGSWLSYVMVENVDEAAKRIVELEGKIWREPSDIPGVGRFAVAADPTGAMFAVFA